VPETSITVAYWQGPHQAAARVVVDVQVQALYRAVLVEAHLHRWHRGSAACGMHVLRSAGKPGLTASLREILSEILGSRGRKVLWHRPSTLYLA
jgi:hypothetical protein